jgi:hypothetical protein
LTPRDRHTAVFTALAGQAKRWTALELPGLPTSRRLLSRLAEFTSLRELSFYWPEGLADVPPLPSSLEQLTIHGVLRQLPAPALLARLECLPRLRRLALPVAGQIERGSDRHILDGLGEVLSRLSGPVLDLEFRGGVYQPLAVLTRLPGAENIRRLEFDEQRLGDADFRALANCDRLTGLRSLRLINTRLTPSCVELLADSPALAGLRELDLFGVALGTDGLRALLRSRHLTRLRALNVDSNRLGGEAAVALAAWPGLLRLREIGLAFNRLERGAVEQLLRSPNLSPLARVSLFENRPDRAPFRLRDIPPEIIRPFGERLLL